LLNRTAIPINQVDDIWTNAQEYHPLSIKRGGGESVVDRRSHPELRRVSLIPAAMPELSP